MLNQSLLNDNVKAENDLKLIPMKNLTITIFIILLAFSASKEVACTVPLNAESPISYQTNTIHTDSLLLDILDDYIEVFSSYYLADFDGHGKGLSEFSEKNHIIRVFKDSNNVEFKNIMILRFYFFSEIPFADFNVLNYKENYFYYRMEELSGLTTPERLKVPNSLISMVVDSNFKDDYYKNISILITHTPIVFHYKLFLSKNIEQDYRLSRKLYSYYDMIDYDLWPIKNFNTESQNVITNSGDYELALSIRPDWIRKIHRKELRKKKNRRVFRNISQYREKVIDKWVILN